MSDLKTPERLEKLSRFSPRFRQTLRGAASLIRSIDSERERLAELCRKEHAEMMAESQEAEVLRFDLEAVHADNWKLRRLVADLEEARMNNSSEAALWRGMSKAERDVVVERSLQIEHKDYTPEFDDRHDKGELASAAVNYAFAAATTVRARLPKCTETTPPIPSHARPSATWPWAFSLWCPGTPRRMLVKAAALLIAEIERLDRLEEKRAKEAA